MARIHCTQRHFDSIGIDKRNFFHFCIYFIGSANELLIKTSNGSKWEKLWCCPHKSFHLKDRFIYRHLLGICWIARSYPTQGKYFAIEIRNDIGTLEKYNLCKKIVKAIPHPLIIQTDRRKTLQLYWFFHRVRLEAEIRESLRTILLKNNLLDLSDKFKIFPGTCGFLRLPLGYDSTILNTKTLRSKGLTLSQSITFVKGLPKYGEFIFGTSPVKKKSVSSIYRGGLISENEKRTIELFDKLNRTLVKRFSRTYNLRDKLWGPIIQGGTRYNRQQILIQYCYGKKYSEDQTYKKIFNWYQSEEHCSKDWTQEPLRVLQELRESIRQYYEVRNEFNQVTKVPIPTDAVQKILMPFQDDYTDWNNSIKNRHKFMFNLIQLFISQGTKILPLPSMILGILDGAGFMSASQHMSFWIRHKALSVLPKEIGSSYRCFRYKLEWDFTATSTVPDFEYAFSGINRYTKVRKRHKKKQVLIRYGERNRIPRRISRKF